MGPSPASPSPQRIAHYRVTAKLGEGGMGEVWRATDSKLNRDVAIKILPEAFAADPDRLARFTREAQVLASLNHPNIAAIYGVEDRALILELVEGPTLAERIAAGPIPIEEALPIARQIAEALEYAHERGIIHRDLKPANIKVTPEGRVKVLDFGLAKAMAADLAPADPMSSPTLTMRATMAGLIMGTAGYMSPEQAKGKPADRRSDIWAFGVVVVEMLTGRVMYAGETVSETLASVIKDRPDLSGLPADTPAPVRRLIGRCLEKDPLRRLQAIGEARIAIETQAEETTAPAPEAAKVSPARPIRWVAATAACALIAAAALGVAWRATRPVERPMMRFSVDLGPDAVRGPHNTVAISPDGTRIVYPVRAANNSTVLATRVLDQAKATVLGDTEGGYDPFFSPDGQWIGFFSRDSLRKISAQGGGAVNLLRITSGPRGAAWGEDGYIIANLDNNKLERIPAGGGKSEPLAALPPQYKERTWRWPQLLPGGDSVLFTGSLGAGFGSGYEEANLETLSLRTMKRTVVAPRTGYYGRYLPSGHLVYVHEGALFAVAFDPVALKTRGTPIPVLEDLSAAPGQGAGQFDCSRTGTFVYLAGKPVAGAPPLVLLDREGKTREVLVTTTAAASPSLSPDGKRLAVSTGGQILVADLERGTQIRLTSGGLQHNSPAWAPDGKHIAFSQEEASGSSIWWMRADGSAPAHRLYETKSVAMMGTFSPDGRRLALSLDAGGNRDLWTIPLDLKDPEKPVAGTPEPFLQEPGNQSRPAFSPDGRWIAYDENTDGQWNVFVRPFPPNPAGGKWKINLGRNPAWSHNGKELLYYGSSQVMAANYSVRGLVFEPGQVRPWSETEIGPMGSWRNFDIAPDGNRVVCAPAFRDQDAKAPPRVTVLLNFFDELKRRIP
jgi:serine/threonine-protein kinase